MANVTKSGKGQVLLVDDDLAVRRGVGALLGAASYAFTLFESGDDFLNRRDGVDLSHAAMLLDVYMPGIDGLALQKRLREEGVNLPIVVMTAHGDVPMAVRAMRGGAIDFLEKPFTADELFASLDRAFSRRPESNGDICISRDRIKKAYASLSPREREVFLDIVGGSTNKETARKLEVSPRTIEVHRRNIMAKMNAKTFADLVRMAVALDVIA